MRQTLQARVSGGRGVSPYDVAVGVARDIDVPEAEVIDQLWQMVDAGELIEVAIQIGDSDIAESRLFPKGTIVTILPEDRQKTTRVKRRKM